MERLAAVRGRGERDLGVAQPEGVGGAGLDQRQRLQRLDGRAREDRARGIAAGERHAAPHVDHGVGGAMAALDGVAASHLDDDRIGRSAGEPRGAGGNFIHELALHAGPRCAAAARGRNTLPPTPGPCNVRRAMRGDFGIAVAAVGRSRSLGEDAPRDRAQGGPSGLPERCPAVAQIPTQFGASLGTAGDIVMDDWALAQSRPPRRRASSSAAAEPPAEYARRGRRRAAGRIRELAAGAAASARSRTAASDDRHGD